MHTAFHRPQRDHLGRKGRAHHPGQRRGCDFRLSRPQADAREHRRDHRPTPSGTDSLSQSPQSHCYRNQGSDERRPARNVRSAYDARREARSEAMETYRRTVDLRASDVLRRLLFHFIFLTGAEPMAFRLPLRFTQALDYYRRHAQAHKLQARNISETASQRTREGWILRDDGGTVARVRADGSVLMQEGA